MRCKACSGLWSVQTAWQQSKLPPGRSKCPTNKIQWSMKNQWRCPLRPWRICAKLPATNWEKWREGDKYTVNYQLVTRTLHKAGRYCKAGNFSTRNICCLVKVSSTTTSLLKLQCTVSIKTLVQNWLWCTKMYEIYSLLKYPSTLSVCTLYTKLPDTQFMNLAYLILYVNKLRTNILQSIVNIF